MRPRSRLKRRLRADTTVHPLSSKRQLARLYAAFGECRGEGRQRTAKDSLVQGTLGSGAPKIPMVNLESHPLRRSAAPPPPHPAVIGAVGRRRTGLDSAGPAEQGPLRD
jgi:hypothetical protein